MVTATFRFNDALNIFLPREHRGKTFTCLCAEGATTKHMIEALGVPHTEVRTIHVNRYPATLGLCLEDGDLVEVNRTDSQQEEPAGSDPAMAGPMLFIADAHLGALARLLRMAGFDTLYANDFKDEEIEALAQRDDRIVLTRDRELLKRRGVRRGCYIRTLKPVQQAREVFGRLRLATSIAPFTRCLACNTRLRHVEKCAVEHRLPPSVRQLHSEFSTCDQCCGVFWKGSHWRRMGDILDNAINGDQAG